METETQSPAQSVTKICADAVKLHPMLTAAELAAVLNNPNIARADFSRRLPEIEADTGEVRRAPKRKCKVSGHTALTWIHRDSESLLEHIRAATPA